MAPKMETQVVETEKHREAIFMKINNKEAQVWIA